jgi:hypothetical protein
MLIDDLALQNVRSRDSIGGRLMNSVLANVSSATTASEPTTMRARISGSTEPRSAGRRER